MPYPVTKTITRETSAVYRGRPLVVELHPGYVTLRQKGRRHRVTVDYEAILSLGYKILARAEREEKLAARKRRSQER